MKNAIRFFQSGVYAVHIIDTKLKGKIDALNNSKLINTYFYPNGTKGWDYLIPAELYNKAARLLK